MDAAKLRAWWWHKQGLDGSLINLSSADALERIGWSRSVGGVNPYLMLWSRNRASREKIDSDAAALEIYELPSARGCTYAVPSTHFALGLKVGQGFSDASAMATATKYLGVTEAEIDQLQEGVVQALQSGDKDPKQLKDALGDAVRNLGPEGKKRGQTTTLPLALGFLKSSGRIRNKPVNGRFDTQRYTYSLMPFDPFSGFNLSKEEAFTALTEKYWRWIGPAKVSEFQWFSGQRKGATAASVEPLNLVPVEPGSDFLILEDELPSFQNFSAPAAPQFQLVSSLDNMSHLRWGLGDLVDPNDGHLSVPAEVGFVQVTTLKENWSHMILDRGRFVGIWEYEPSSESIAWHAWVPIDDALVAAVANMESYIKADLGDARSFSLDSPESRQPRIDMIRSLKRT